MELVKSEERIDDLQREGYRIIQNPEKFCFGMDAVLLSAFARVGEGERVLDMCTGTGVIPILLKARNKCGTYTGVEIQTDVADMALRSVKLNELQGDITIDEGDIKKCVEAYGAASFEVVTVNPPYMNESHGLKNPSDAKAIARHEVLCNLEDVISQASKVLVSGGRFYMVHRPHRLVEIFEKMRAHNIEPKRIRMVHPKKDAEAKMVLIEGLRSGGTWLKVDEPLIIYKEDGTYTEEVLRLYEE